MGNLYVSSTGDLATIQAPDLSETMQQKTCGASFMIISNILEIFKIEFYQLYMKCFN